MYFNTHFLSTQAEDLQTIGDVLRASDSVVISADAKKNTSWVRRND